MFDLGQVFFLVILISSQILFLPASFSRLSSFHRVFTIILCIIPYIFTYKTIKSTSSYISYENHAIHMQKYPYDHIIFQPGRVCHTCRFLKPARSKHCSICRACVAKHDHHCVWVMNCIGKSNYVYFVGMLLSLAVLLAYGGYVAHFLLTECLQKETLRLDHDVPAGQRWSAGISWERYLDLWLWAISEDIRIGGVGMLAALTAPLAWGLLLYHVYLIWAGMTTNESSKWADLKDDIADGLVFQSKRRARNINDRSLGTEIEPIVNWPISNKRWLVRRDDGQPPDDEIDIYADPALTRMTPRKSSWQRLQSLSEVNNIYDLGFRGNIADVMAT